MPRSILSALLAFAVLAQPAAALGAAAPFPHAQLARFAARVARRDALDRRWVLGVLEQAREQPDIVGMMNRPAEKVLQWWQYRRIFLTPKRIALGVQFWREHREALERTGAQWGVAPRYIVAILGVETYYGRLTGGYRVLDALSTLAFDYPSRGRYFGHELAKFLVLAHRDGLDPLTVKGSYAGAMGPMQFMPSNCLRYAVSTDGHPPDLLTNWDDIFASVANYLHAHGWQAGGPVLAPVSVEPQATFHIDPDDLALDRTIGALAAEGAKVESDAPADTPVALLLAQERTGPAYRAGFHNFRVILSYNYSAMYVMAVNDLAQAIARQMSRPPPALASSRAG
jgi:membrane-bound lytic murein transglycosylase B